MAKTEPTPARTKAVANWKDRQRAKGRKGRDYWATSDEHEELSAHLKKIRSPNG